MITVSIVSHGHGLLFPQLIKSILNFSLISKVIITINIKEKFEKINNKKIIYLYNNEPKPFSVNHNNAFIYCDTEYYCVLNPDIYITDNIFANLLPVFNDRAIAMATCKVININGENEYNIRYIPTPLMLLRKVLGIKGWTYMLNNTTRYIYPECAAGMFMLFRSIDYQTLNGFSERYYLYYEDFDICMRINNIGKKIIYDKDVILIHDARRDSHRKFKFFIIHLKSLLTFWILLFRKRYNTL
jgi:N-acetylglucosaminyl-diphospho-decaprenol L-rhamnosyltransferase